MRVVSRKLLVNPTKIENAVNLAHQMVRWHDLVEIKSIKELALLALPSTHHEPLPADARLKSTESPFVSCLNRSFATQSPETDKCPDGLGGSGVPNITRVEALRLQYHHSSSMGIGSRFSGFRSTHRG